jgi:NTP pyrophosphatase (non-canonical NTP hydrolase)
VAEEGAELAEKSQVRHWRDKPVERGWDVESNAVVWLPLTLEEAGELLRVINKQPFSEQDLIRMRLFKEVRKVEKGE